MRQAIRVLILSLCITAIAHAGPATTQSADDGLYKAGPGNWKVKVIDQTWHDASRNRDVPVRIYLPQSDSPVKLPVVVFSHGWGANRFTYAYFCNHLASNGYLVISPTHLGSDTASMKLGGGGLFGLGGSPDTEKKPLERLRERIKANETKAPDAQPSTNGEKQEGLMQSIDDPDNLRNRPKDITFVLDEIGRNDELRNIADLTRVGVAGHSFGAYTAMVEGGMLVDLPEGKKQSLRDPRVKAVLPMSPEGRGEMGISNGAWDRFATPVLFLTGTKDYGTGEHAASWRREAFDSIHNVDAYLAIIANATHFTFAFPDRDAGSTSPPAPGNPTNSPNGRLIDSLGTAFFDAKLMDDAKAAAWLKMYFSTKHENCQSELEAKPEQ